MQLKTVVMMKMKMNQMLKELIRKRRNASVIRRRLVEQRIKLELVADKQILQQFQLLNYTLMAIIQLEKFKNIQLTTVKPLTDSQMKKRKLLMQHTPKSTKTLVLLLKRIDKQDSICKNGLNLA